jgi:hypothetical protein
MNTSTIRFSTFPRTEPPPDFIEGVVAVFRQHESEIATEINDKGLNITIRCLQSGGDDGFEVAVPVDRPS